MGLSELSDAAIVSKSMLSAIERGAKVPSILIVARIANGLGVTVSRLLEEQQDAGVVIIRCGDHPKAGPLAQWERQILSPVVEGAELEFMRTRINPYVTPGVFSPHPPGTLEYIFVSKGKLKLTVDGIDYLISAGDSICYPGDRWHAFDNPHAVPCVYYMVTCIPVDTSARRTVSG